MNKTNKDTHKPDINKIMAFLRSINNGLNSYEETMIMNILSKMPTEEDVYLVMPKQLGISQAYESMQVYNQIFGK